MTHNQDTTLRSVAGQQGAIDAVAWDECAATGRSCEYEPQGPNGEHQCQYCGKSSPQPALAVKGVTDATKYFVDDKGVPLDLGAGDVLAIHENLPETPQEAYAMGWNQCRSALVAPPHSAEALREAVEPFVAVLDEYDPSDEDDETPGTFVAGSVTDYSLTLGDFRRARRALSVAPATADGWRTMDSAPKDGWDSPLSVCRIGEPNDWYGKQLVAGYADVPGTAYWNDTGDCWTWTDRPHDACEPTHWRPLASLPDCFDCAASAGEGRP